MKNVDCVLHHILSKNNIKFTGRPIPKFISLIDCTPGFFKYLCKKSARSQIPIELKHTIDSLFHTLSSRTLFQYSQTKF